MFLPVSISLTSCESDAKSYERDIFLYTCIMCYCDISASAYTSADTDEAKKTEEFFHDLEAGLESSLRLTTEANRKYNFLVTAMVTDTEDRKLSEAAVSSIF